MYNCDLSSDEQRCLVHFLFLEGTMLFVRIVYPVVIQFTAHSVPILDPLKQQLQNCLPGSKPGGELINLAKKMQDFLRRVFACLSRCFQLQSQKGMKSSSKET